MKSVHTDRYKDIITKLVEARKQAGLTQAEVADKLGKPQSYVSKVESGERRLDVLEFVEACDAIGIEPVEIL